MKKAAAQCGRSAFEKSFAYGGKLSDLKRAQTN